MPSEDGVFSLDNDALIYDMVVIMKRFANLFKDFLLWGGLSLLLAGCGKDTSSRSDYLMERYLKPVTGDFSRQLSPLALQNKGYVIAVQDKKVFIDLTAKDGLVPGVLLKIYREGEETILTHPATGEVLASFKNELGTIRILEISNKFSIGYLESLVRGKEVRPGDRVFLVQ